MTTTKTDPTLALASLDEASDCRDDDYPGCGTETVHSRMFKNSQWGPFHVDAKRAMHSRKIWADPKRRIKQALYSLAIHGYQADFERIDRVFATWLDKEPLAAITFIYPNYERGDTFNLDDLLGQLYTLVALYRLQVEKLAYQLPDGRWVIDPPHPRRSRGGDGSGGDG